MFTVSYRRSFCKTFFVLLAILLLPGGSIMATECYRFLTFSPPTPFGIVGQVSFEGLTEDRILLRWANQEPPDGVLARRLTGSNLDLVPFAAIADHVTWPRAINSKRDTGGMIGRAGVFSKFTGYIRRANGSVQIIDVPDSTQSEVLDLNDRLDAVGYFHRDDLAIGFWRFKGAFLEYRHPEALNGTHLTAITNGTAGGTPDLLGWYIDGGNVIHGVRIAGGAETTLDVPGAWDTLPEDMNDQRWIVGMDRLAESPGFGFLLKDGVYYRVTPNVGETSSVAMGITNNGLIAGNYEDTTGHHGFLALPQPTCPAGSVVLPVLE